MTEYLVIYAKGEESERFTILPDLLEVYLWRMRNLPLMSHTEIYRLNNLNGEDKRFLGIEEEEEK